MMWFISIEYKLYILSLFFVNEISTWLSIFNNYW